MNNRIFITCYGTRKEYTLKNAVREFTNACYGCDPNSHEHRRYEYILECLRCGDTEINDEEA